MRRTILTSIKRILKALFYGLVGGFIVLMAVFILHLERRPDLKIWHEANLDAEFTADSSVNTFEEYLALEARLFAQLEKRVCARIEPEDQRRINRFYRGSLSDPGRWTSNWNRTFEFTTDTPRAGVLLLHGMSDSPYSLRSVGERLHAAGAWVVGLRLPGHGTAPSGLVEVRWEDMAAAVRLAVRNLRDKIGNKPLYILGYSNGGALGVHYALESLEDPTLPKVKALVLISPAIGVTPLAALAVWQARIGHLLGLDKLAWNDILPEYDPFKYQSFAVNAGHQVHRLTSHIRSKIEKLSAAGEAQHFPPVLAFQSVADATVSTQAVVDGLFARLPVGGHELVLFDINRNREVKQVLMHDPGAGITALFRDPDLSFTISLVTNESEKVSQVVVCQKGPDKRISTKTPLDLKWPTGVYSLSHVALPFPFDDPLYGGSAAVNSPGIKLGNVALRGERGVLQIPAADMLRLRWNPFYSYMEQRLIEFFHLEGAK
ncbi:MAG: alpha/beta fold hydrolase [Deltaproteobacteria bacterium]|nr:alpha/beta fold hydrolase [Deltaproteobacteria bacterium]MBW2597139.1 alpha/beta fold hydrolase [Deltaproteobacteria bacterium]MBW2638579.1 alpha/beta fold hydrolase [Deltaproteobacteria bacterium]MBW2680291.1 alpha/beta fold hydrolase [Deltaproteobacteria bacterium]RLC15008.1 MAG: alpha/beta hydrolase [Deltaproteobacteria bacterium]